MGIAETKTSNISSPYDPLISNTIKAVTATGVDYYGRMPKWKKKYVKAFAKQETIWAQ